MMLLTLLPAGSHAASPNLFYLEEIGANACAARTLELPSNTERAVFVAPACPTAIAWDPMGRRELFVSKDRLWEHRTGMAPKEVTSLAPVPGPALAWSSGGTGKLWVNGHGRPQVAYLFDAEQAGLTIVSAKTAGTSMPVVRYEGRRLELQGESAPYVAACEELDQGQWRMIEVKSTTWGFDMALGFSALDCYRKAERGTNLDDLTANSTCGETLSCETELDAAIKQRVLAQNPHAADTLFAALNIGTMGRFLFAVIEGDSLHPASPVFFCAGSCESPTPLVGLPDNTLSLSAAGDYVVIATEYENASPRIYSANGRLVRALPKARSAVWLPALPGH